MIELYYSIIAGNQDDFFPQQLRRPWLLGAYAEFFSRKMHNSLKFLQLLLAGYIDMSYTKYNANCNNYTCQRKFHELSFFRLFFGREVGGRTINYKLWLITNLNFLLQHINRLNCHLRFDDMLYWWWDDLKRC